MKMANIKLTGGFTMMEEGEQILQITKVEFDENFGKLNITCENEKGQRHFEQYRFYTTDGSTNDKAIGAFSSFAKAALGDNSAEEVDTDALVGRYIKGFISYREYEDKEGNTKKATQKAPGTWWETPSEEEVAIFGEAKSAAAKPKVDLKSLFGK